MSMLSEQCARLRSWAVQFDDRADLDALAPLVARDLREAADTIISLRDRLQADVLLSETCNPVETAMLENATAHVMECDMCGRTYEHVNGAYPRCPHCGRKAER